MVSTGSHQEIIVAWDSEFDSINGAYGPVSDQIYCNHCDTPYFLPHVGGGSPQSSS